MKKATISFNKKFLLWFQITKLILINWKQMKKEKVFKYWQIWGQFILILKTQRGY